MDLLEGASSVEDVRAEFRLLLESLDRSSSSPTKNRPVEAWLRRVTGWQKVAFKYVGDQKNLYNRISELGNRPDISRYFVVLVPKALVKAAQGTAETLIRVERKYDAIGIVVDTPDPVITDFVCMPSVSVPRLLSEVFPEMRTHLVGPPENELPLDIPDSGPESAESRSDGLAEGKVVSIGAETDTVYTVADCAKKTHIDEEVLQSWLRRLDRKKHLVFQGPPGTGKTYLAKHLAKVVVAGSLGKVELVQFHPSYSYEDFVQGIRPIIHEGTVQYDLLPGRFLEFCDRARRNPDAPFVLIIDELNRGNVSRIFGELLYLLEYRSESIPLAQGQEPFSVPKNVRIIATMNTADRSIALIDHALRRRFSFVFLAPDYKALAAHLEELGLDAKQLVGVLERVNAAIGDRNYHLGTSFFLAAESELPEVLREIWEGEIEPYLEEYFFDQPEKVEVFRWSKLVKAELSWWAREAKEDPVTHEAQ